MLLEHNFLSRPPRENSLARIFAFYIDTLLQLRSRRSLKQFSIVERREKKKRLPRRPNYNSSFSADRR